ncbi:MAG: FTR1 family protein [Salibacteraceae bacterium]|nr:FTR1 family protein [Salibacteraceae bacterium]MDP4687958.1 FTR1 family protein [Salibacteraceae bacterium]MDP4764034.1 FTR1 family protein [Salibacteraceae bacterium]MDP4965976.1 FTR1 family protein [Salibacteraceae bacterium]
MAIRNYIASITLLFCFALPVFSISHEETTKVRMVINLMDYIAKDYAMAVKDGEIANEFEFAEMQEFSENASVFYSELEAQGTVKQDTKLFAMFDELKSLIASKASPEIVGTHAGKIRESMVEMKLVSLAPNAWPNLENGKTIFRAECASCHGYQGKGDGTAGAALSPAPTNFHNQDVINNISPLQAFNTITLGIDGTAMRAFNELSQAEIWDLSFYILSLQHEGKTTKDAKNTSDFSLEEIATLSNEKLLAINPNVDIAALRTSAPEAAEKDELAVAKLFLAQSQTAAQNGDFDEATALALKAYLQGVEPVEPRIKASDNKLFEELETAMMAVRAELKNKSNIETLNAAYADANLKVDEATKLLGAAKRGMLMTAGIALTILLREGLEAFFVILAILSILQSMGAKTAIKWVHSGWVTAVAFGITGWFFAGSIMTWDAQNRELMEGLIALFAVGVLLYLGFWMHGHANASKWKTFVEVRVKGLISKNNMIGLASFSFLVVFREAFESVLFLSSLTLDGSSDSSIGVLVGSISAAALLFAIAYALLKWFKKLPIGKVFLYSSMVILALAFVLAGNGIHAIQEGGYIDIRSFPVNLKISAIGLYPTYETILAQLVVLAMIVGLWKFSNKRVSKPQGA